MKSTTRMFMKNGLCYAIMLAIALTFSVAGKANRLYFFYADSASVEGRWDITIDMAGKEVPSWLEVRHSGLHTLIGEFVGASGSARPVSRVNLSGGKMSFTIPPQWENGNDVTV